MDISDRCGQFAECLGLSVEAVEASGNSGHANDGSRGVRQWNFSGHDQIRRSLGFRSRLDPVGEVLPGSHHVLVIVGVHLGSELRKEIEIRFSDGLAFGRDSTVIPSAPVESLEAAGAILDKEEDVGQDVCELHQRTKVANFRKELLPLRFQVHAGFVHKTGELLQSNPCLVLPLSARSDNA